MPYKRKHFLIHKKYQLRYTAYIIAAMLSVAAAISVLTFTLIYPLLSAKLSEAVTETISRDLASGLLFSYWISVFVLVIVASIFGILFSHRIVGPINRMSAVIAGFEDGDISKRIVVREKDEFAPLAGAINAFMDKISDALSGILKEISSIESDLKELEKNLNEENLLKGETKEKLESILRKQECVYKELSKYKT